MNLATTLSEALENGGAYAAYVFENVTKDEAYFFEYALISESKRGELQ